MQIILVDDNDDFCAVTAQLLTRAGHTVRTANNGPDARALLREAPADLLITDILMPSEDGLELMAKVRREFPDVALVGISGSSPRAALYLKMASKLGASAILQKPFSIDELSIAIARLELGRVTKGRPEKT